MHRCLLFLMLFTILCGCSPGSEELEAAQTAEAAGDLLAAVDLYTTVIDTYPTSNNAQQADQALLRIYSNYAESLEKDHPVRAMNIYDVIINRWPETTSAEHASTRYRLLKTKEEKEKERLAADQEACEEAKQAASKDNWTAYIENHPNGKCLAMANHFLTRRPMSKEELSTTQAFLSQCAVHQKQCKSYKTRYDAVIRKKRLDYVNRVLVPYAKREHDKAKVIIERASVYLDGLAAKNIDVESQLEAITESCTVCTDITSVEE